ncbi:MAG: C_GCAxxG_C_C family protein [Clostridia bacterium]|nr:C_GCAxxG_C_C family protein [Clostridia bacterium]
MSKREIANNLHIKGYNCAQSVICAFSEELGVDKATLFRLTEGLGLGMGCTKGVCGALSAAVAAIGLKSSSANLENPNTKAATYSIAKGFTEEFESRAGSIICKELKGISTGVPLCPCPECIGIGVDILEKYLSDK